MTDIDELTAQASAINEKMAVYRLLEKATDRLNEKVTIMDDTPTLKARFLAAPDDPKNVLNVAKEMKPEELKAALSAYFSQKTAPELSFDEQEKLRIAEITAKYQPLQLAEGEKLTFERIKAHFAKYFKDDLTYFGSKENRVYLDELRAIEPLTKEIYRKLYDLRKYKKSIPLLGDIIPTRDERTDNRLEKKAPEERKGSVKDVSAARRRHIKQASQHLPEPHA